MEGRLQLRGTVALHLAERRPKTHQIKQNEDNKHVADEGIW